MCGNTNPMTSMLKFRQWAHCRVLELRRNEKKICVMFGEYFVNYDRVWFARAHSSTAAGANRDDAFDALFW